MCVLQAIVCGEDVAHGKPAPDAFLLAAQQLGVEPQHCVGYEDAVLGMEAIRNAGGQGWGPRGTWIGEKALPCGERSSVQAVQADPEASATQMAGAGTREQRACSEGEHERGRVRGGCRQHGWRHLPAVYFGIGGLRECFTM